MDTRFTRAAGTRLSSIARQLRAPQAINGAAAAPPSRPPATSQQPQQLLFTDAQMRDYLRQGFAILPGTDIPAAVHEQIYQRCKEVEGENPGNDILAKLPGLQQVFDTPLVSGALRSVLGSGYAIHRHRHLHSSSTTDQFFHKDSHWGMNRMRHHRPRLCMVLYYPHAVADAAGPTAIVPGSSYLEMPLGAEDQDRLSSAHRNDNYTVRDHAVAETVGRIGAELAELKLTVLGGSCVLMSYDMFHRGTRRLAEEADWRCMLKFQFYATEHRTLPSWDAGGAEEQQRGSDACDVAEKDVVSSSILEFLSGGSSGSAIRKLPIELSTAAAAGAALRAGETEADRMTAAYALAQLSCSGQTDAVETLSSALQEQGSRRAAGGQALRPYGFDGLDPVQRAAMHGLASAGAAAVAPLLDLVSVPAIAAAPVITNAAAFALGEAVASPGALAPTTAAAVSALLVLASAAAAAAEAEAGPFTKGDRHSGGGDRPGNSMGRMIFATVLQSLGVAGQVVVAQRNIALAEAIVEQVLLPALLRGEPAGSWNDRGTGDVGGGERQMHPCRENAAMALVWLAPEVVAGRLRHAVLHCLRAATVCNGEEEYVAAYAAEALARCKNSD